MNELRYTLTDSQYAGAEEMAERTKLERIKKTRSEKEVKPETRKLTVNLPEKLFKRLEKESFIRKQADKKNPSMTAIVKEALSTHLT